jgi:transcriptional regulator with XRE-family HTH domain
MANQPPWRDEVRQALIQARDYSGYKTSELAILVGLSDRQVRRIEEGSSEPLAEVVDKWFKATKVNTYIRSYRADGKPWSK